MSVERGFFFGRIFLIFFLEFHWLWLFWFDCFLGSGVIVGFGFYDARFFCRGDGEWDGKRELTLFFEEFLVVFFLESVVGVDVIVCILILSDQFIIIIIELIFKFVLVTFTRMVYAIFIVVPAKLIISIFIKVISIGIIEVY